MTNEQILKKAIEKAVENGWKMWNMEDVRSEIVNDKRCSWSDAREFGIAFMGGGVFSVNDVIFSHDFAKAFWKDSKTRWDIHLQRMVIWPEPLKYLERFLKGG